MVLLVHCQLNVKSLRALLALVMLVDVHYQPSNLIFFYFIIKIKFIQDVLNQVIGTQAQIVVHLKSPTGPLVLLQMNVKRLMDLAAIITPVDARRISIFFIIFNLEDIEDTNRN